MKTRTITHHQGAHTNALNKAIEVTTSDGISYTIEPAGQVGQSLTFSGRHPRGPSPEPDGVTDEALLAILEDRAGIRAADGSLTPLDRGTAGKVLEHLRHAREWLQNITEEIPPKVKPEPKPMKNLSFEANGIKPAPDAPPAFVPHDPDELRAAVTPPPAPPAVTFPEPHVPTP